jgi:elongation factor P
MPKASNLKKGDIVKIEGGVYIAREIDVQTPSARGSATLYKVRFHHVTTRQKLELTFKGGEMLELADLARRSASFLYRDREDFVFMDSGDYGQYTLPREQLGDQVDWLTEGMEGISLMLLDGLPLAVELPAAVELEIVETPPAIKGATATNRTKPAVLTNGVEIQVPDYLAAGDRVRVNTQTGKFMSRA